MKDRALFGQQLRCTFFHEIEELFNDNGCHVWLKFKILSSWPKHKCIYQLNTFIITTSWYTRAPSFARYVSSD